MERQARFGLPDTKYAYEKGKWYVLYVHGQTSYSGQVSEVTKHRVTLMPSLSTDWKDGNLIYDLLKRKIRVSLSEIVADEETTEKSIRGSASYKNKQEAKR